MNSDDLTKAERAYEHMDFKSRNGLLPAPAAPVDECHVTMKGMSWEHDGQTRFCGVGDMGNGDIAFATSINGEFTAKLKLSRECALILYHLLSERLHLPIPTTHE